MWGGGAEWDNQPHQAGSWGQEKIGSLGEAAIETATPTPSPAVVYNGGLGVRLLGSEKHRADWHGGEAVGEQGRVFEDKATLITTRCPYKIDLLRVSKRPLLGVHLVEVGILSLLKRCIIFRRKNFSKAVLLQL